MIVRRQMKTSKTEIKVCRVNSTRCEWRNVEINTHLYWPCSVFDAGVYNRMRMYWNTWFGDKFAWNSNSRTLRMPSSLSINCDFFTSYTKHTETSRKKPFRVRYKAACTFIYIRMRLIPCRIFIQCLLAAHSIQRMDSFHSKITSMYPVECSLQSNTISQFIWRHCNNLIRFGCQGERISYGQFYTMK